MALSRFWYGKIEIGVQSSLGYFRVLVVDQFDLLCHRSMHAQPRILEYLLQRPIERWGLLKQFISPSQFTLDRFHRRLAIVCLGVSLNGVELSCVWGHAG